MSELDGIPRGAQRAAEGKIVGTVPPEGMYRTSPQQIDDRYQVQGMAMRIFAFEYMSGGGLAGQPMIAGLAEEGEMILRALVDDLTRVPGVEVIITRDARLGDPGLEAITHMVWSSGDLARCWARCVQEVEWVWPIAPETDGILESLSGAVLDAGRGLLNSSPEAVRVAASKVDTASCLKAGGLAVIETWRADALPLLDGGGWVLKPEYGMGCQETRLFRDSATLAAAIADKDKDGGTWAVQPFTPGEAASLSLLVADGKVALLGCNRQRVALADDGFVLLGCVVNALDGDRNLYEEIARGVVAAMPGLWGYVGVDLMITDEGPMILEVNPRLTTSYVGLSRSLEANVAHMVLTLAGHTAPPVRASFPGRRVEVELETYRVA